MMLPEIGLGSFRRVDRSGTTLGPLKVHRNFYARNYCLLKSGTIFLLIVGTPTMPKIIGLIPFLALLFSLTLAGGCKKSEGNSSADEQFKQTLSQGSWTVDYYFDQKEETTDFAGFLFVFKPEGTVNVTRGNINAGGSWELIVENGKRNLVLNFVTNSIVQKLNDSWIIINTSANKIELKDDNPSNFHELHFSRL